MSEYVIISNSTDFFRFVAENIVFIVSDGNYSYVYTCDKKKHMLLAQLGKIEEKITNQFNRRDQFLVRIGKSLIVNMLYISHINPSQQKIVFSDNRTFTIDSTTVEGLKVSKEAVKGLKDYFDKKQK